MSKVDDLIARLAAGEIDLAAAQAQLRELTLVGGDARTALQTACERASLEPGTREALLNALDATRLQSGGDDDAATVLSPGPGSAGDAPTEINPSFPGLAGDGDDEVTRKASRPGANIDDAPTELTSGQGEADTEAPTELATGTQAGATASDWARPDRWEQKHQGRIGVGTVLKERFVLEELLGRGGMGSVYRARDLRRVEAEDRETDVAIKLINEDFQQHPDAMVALQREAKKSQTLAHPNIVTVYDFDRDGATVYVSMAYLQGKPLDVLIRKTAPDTVPMKQGLDIIRQLADGLAYAHKKGFAHADFKPGNVFITDKGDARILDFGIARAATDAAAADSPIGLGAEADLPEATGGDDNTRFDPTTLGAITPAYASLEMLERKPPLPSDDVYALACVAYEILTGKHPFVDDNGKKLPANEAARQQLKPAPIKGLPRRYQRAIGRGLAFRRTDRYADASAFVNAISAPARIRRSVAAITLLLAVTAGVSWWYSYEQSELSVSMADLPAMLDASRELLTAGDRFLENGKIAEAHKAYAQAWDNGRTLPGLSSGDLKQLRVLVDRRVNKVIAVLLARSRQADIDNFARQVLLLNLESLQKSDLGSRDQDIAAAIDRIERQLSEKG